MHKLTIDLRNPETRNQIQQQLSGRLELLTVTVIGEDGLVQHLHLSATVPPQTRRYSSSLRLEMTGTLPGPDDKVSVDVRPWFRAEPWALADFEKQPQPAIQS